VIQASEIYKVTCETTAFLFLPSAKKFKLIRI